MLAVRRADAEVADHRGLPLNGPVAEVRLAGRSRDGTVIYLGEATFGAITCLDRDPARRPMPDQIESRVMQSAARVPAP